MYKRKTKKYCSVSVCKGCIKEDKHIISLHLPPLDKGTYNKWCIALNVKVLPKKALVCSKHFLPEDYYPVVNGKRKTLKKGTIPTQNLPISLITSLPKDPELGEKRKSRLNNRRIKKLKLLDKENENKSKDCDNSNESRSATIEDDEGSTVDTQINNGTLMDSGDILVDDAVLQNDLMQLDMDSDKVDLKADKNIQVNLINDNQEIKSKATILDFLDSDDKLYTYTGIKSFEILNTMVECIRELRKILKKRTIAMTIKDCVLLTFIKLKQNQNYKTIDILFHINYQAAKKCFVNILIELVQVLSPLIRWPSRDEILQNMPKCFSKYKNTRVILDCLEIQIRQSKCLKCRIPTYSNYKSCHTVKFLVGDTPSGMISYVSKGYGGRASDKFIFNKSNLLNRMIRSVDAIMVDRGFLIDQECEEYGIKLIRPPFLKKKKQLSGKEAIMNADIAAARVHVERRIQRLRLFKILQGPLETEIVPYINIIMKIICATTNLYSPILAINKFIGH